MEYLDFDLEMSAGNGGYSLKVLHSPAGEAEGMLRLPFDQAALEEYQLKLQDALAPSGGEQRRAFLSGAPAIQEFGLRLFEALFAGEVGTRYAVSRNVCAQKGKGLRLRLRIQAPELAMLPWEYLYDQREGDYLSLSQTTPLVRYLDLPQTIQPLTVTPPLRLLAMIASPTDQAPLDIAHEKALMHEALKDLEEQGQIKVRWLEGQTWQELQEAMWKGPWHIFHFIGHGGFDSSHNEGILALADEHGKTHLLTAASLGRLLAGHQHLRLAVLNACQGAKGSQTDRFSSTAAMLARRGLPAVLAMREEISDKAALQWSRTFYRALAAGIPVDGAVVEARKAISLSSAHTLEWGTPVLYLRSPNGVLFDLPSQPATAVGAKKQPAGDALKEKPSPLPPRLAPALVVFSIAGGAPPLRISVPLAGMTIGRDGANALPLADPAVSRQHLRLHVHEGMWMVTRLPNTGPLYHNGRQCDQAELQPYDQVVIGGTLLRFESSDPQSGVSNLSSEQAPLLVTAEPVPHLTVNWPEGRFVAPLRESEITLGRAPESGIVVPVAAVSTYHARLHRLGDGSYLIEDQMSRNGLTFQERRVREHRFQHGDQLTIGSQADGQFVTLRYATPRR